MHTPGKLNAFRNAFKCSAILCIHVTKLNVLSFLTPANFIALLTGKQIFVLTIAEKFA